MAHAKASAGPVVGGVKPIDVAAELAQNNAPPAPVDPNALPEGEERKIVAYGSDEAKTFTFYRKDN